MKALLVLEDGKSFIGETAWEQNQEAIGEVIFNTSVVGYQEMMTHPANAGKILVLTYPLIGNYGTTAQFNESKKTRIAGLVIKEKTRIYSNWQARQSFDSFVKASNTPVLVQADTRTVAVHLRQKGQMFGIISTRSSDVKELLAKIDIFKKKTPASRLPEISTKKELRLGRATKQAKRAAILDLGVTNGILRQLQALGLSITVFPYNSNAQEILRSRPHGIVVSCGPEDDPALAQVASSVKVLLGKLPMLGIETGHQVICRALGAKITKMRLGHHGVNYPIHHPTSYKGEITVQNHSYVVDADSLSSLKAVKITAYNLNDRTVEEIESRRFKLIGVQYSPASPGCNEINSVFKRFVKMLK